MKLKLLPILAIVMIIAVSGCTQKNERSVTTSENDGIVINEFSIEPASINEDETALFHLELENVGGTTATNVRVALYGAEGWRTVANVVTYSQLNPPNINVQPSTPGDFQIADWELQAPNLPEGVVSPYSVKGRVRYHYHTTNVITIPIYEQQEYNRRNQIGALIDAVSVVNARAPVKVDITPAQFIVYNPSENDTTQSRRLTFSNVGSGVPIGQLNGQDKDGVITGTITLQGPAEFANCINVMSGKTLNIPAGEVTIRHGESVTKACSLKINKNEFGASPTATVSMVMDLDYDYYVESTATVSVAGKR